MNQHVLLNSVDHKDIKIITERSAKYGDNVWFSVTFPAEFRSVQAHYPIFFQKDQTTGQFFAVALYGFQNNENLFLNNGTWQASYIPLTLRRQPFLIGQQSVREDGVELKQRVIHIDMASPKVSTTEGEALFHPYGGNTQYLDDIGDMLEGIHHGLIDSKHFIDLLIEHKLLESFTLDIKLDNGHQHQMMGFYTINEETLAALSAEVLAQFHAKSYLEAIYMTLASQARVRDLLNLKNAQG
ncbi:SapC family protein [Shewanella baltica]|uniref:SapC family protein n=1 Tax=Shewanella baltica TaxID=62322 RepID=UPI00217EEFF2|nr:SapC family protein [Shewanella baltica]MCS6094683.1 SapC family protein [Shewanella baltica]MCS6225659.1 SapC family protein [Shewanella baltica]MDR9765469.1 SapC family protein [Shewanella baltica]